MAVFFILWVLAIRERERERERERGRERETEREKTVLYSIRMTKLNEIISHQTQQITKTSWLEADTMDPKGT